MLPEELDLAINARMFAMMDEQIKPLKDARGNSVAKFKLQYIVDRFQNLQVKELPLTDITQSNQGYTSYYAPLPIDYLHLISDITILLVECGEPVQTGNIVPSHFFLVKGQKSIIYNGQTYTTGTLFEGVTGVTGYTYSGTGSLLLVKMHKRRKSNRLTEEELLYKTLDNSLERTDPDSPVSSLSGNNLYVYVDDFYVNEIVITYLRKPKLVNSQFVKYQAGEVLVVGSIYESVDEPIVYQSNTYNAFQPFTIVTGVLIFTGMGNVRLQGDGDTEFTDSMSYELADRVAVDLSIEIEASQQKVVNLVQQQSNV